MAGLFKEDRTTYYGTPSSGGGTSFSGSAKDVTYDDTETKLGAKNVQDAIGKLSEEFNEFSGTVEVTSYLPEKENTVLTINPKAEEVNVYTAEEVDEKIKTLNLYIISTFEELKTLISNNETDAAVALLDNAILDLSTLV